MNFVEFKSGLENGTLGMQQPYWIVDYRFTPHGYKIHRHIMPTKVLVFDKKVTPASMNIYYSDYYFKKMDRSGLPLKKVIQTFSYDDSGWGINVFISEQEAEDFYKEQCFEVLDEIATAKRLANYDFNLLEKTAMQHLSNFP